MDKIKIQKRLIRSKLLTPLSIALLLILSACNSSEPEDPTPTPTVQNEQTDGGQTDNADDDDSPEPEPAENTTAEEPAEPEEASGGQLQDKGRIEFDAGATGTTISGELAKSSGDSYILNAAAGQIMTLSLDGPTDASIGITNADGLIFEPTGPISFHVTNPLPTTGDYMITVASGSGGSYELMVTIDNKASGSQDNDGFDQQDQGRIQFDPGTTGTTITGEFEAEQINSYVLQVTEGQIMTVVLNGPEGAEFGVSDSGGTLFEPGDILLTAYTSQPLQGGDVTITVGGQTSGNYELTVEVVDEYTLVDKGRIEFDAGATSKSIGGTFSGTTLDSYTISAAAGQLMTINFAGPPNSMFSVRNSANDTTIFNPAEPVSTAAIGPLPETGDYVINVGPSYLGYYELTVTIVNLDQAEALPDGIRVSTTINPLGNAWLIFKGNSEGGSLIQVDGVDIYNLDTGRLHQTLNFRSETSVPVEPPFLVIADVNFDGFTDLGIPTFTTAGSNLPASYFLWDSTVNQFVRNQNFDVLMAPTILDGKRILTTSRAGAGDVYYTIYTVGKSGPRAVAAQNCVYMQDENGEAIVRNRGFSIDGVGNQTQTFEEITTEEGCLAFKDPK